MISASVSGGGGGGATKLVMRCKKECVEDNDDDDDDDDATANGAPADCGRDESSLAPSDDGVRDAVAPSGAYGKVDTCGRVKVALDRTGYALAEARAGDSVSKLFS
jgi:hypothetical protein